MKSRPTRIACTLLLAGILSGCANLFPGSDINVITYQSSGERWLNASFYLIEHPFTDDGAARAKARADQLCAENKRVAVQSERGCTLEQCTTQYVCMKPEDVKAGGL
jgi:hypothetical protein